MTNENGKPLSPVEISGKAIALMSIGTTFFAIAATSFEISARSRVRSLQSFNEMIESALFEPLKPEIVIIAETSGISATSLLNFSVAAWV